VTGSHRSGTTWVGRMIASSPQVGYIHEPFNINGHCEFCTADFPYWFYYVTAEDEDRYCKPISDTLEFRYDLLGKLAVSRNYSQVKKELSNYWTCVSSRVKNLRPLLKDPMALFSADWLSKRFNMQPVVMIRHPAAFCSSIKVLNWSHPFSHFLEQDFLMNTHLYSFRDEIKRFADEEKEVIDQAILLWKLISFMILKYRAENQDWLFVRHEDISRDPISGFEGIFSYLGLGFTNRIVEIIDWHSMSNNNRNKVRPDYRLNGFRRDSETNIFSWKDRLTTAEIEKIKIETEEISKYFYSDSDW
jgi:hypothetical protein